MPGYGDLLRWMYRGPRPNAVARALNRWQAIVAALGLPPHRVQTLEVPGRRSGRIRSMPVVIADVDGERYLVSMLGERAGWVANVRAAGGRAVLRHGRRTPVRLVEVPAPERAPILKRYVELAPGGRPHIPVDPRAPIAEFAAVAGDYPVFRIEPDTG